MATSAIAKIIRFERIYNRKKDARSTYAMALSYYLGYAISGQRELLHKANFVLKQNGGRADLSLSFLRSFVAYESENFDLLEELMAELKSRRNAMKNHQPTFYAHYLYFECLVALTKNKDKAATKAFRSLKDYCGGENIAGTDLLLANLSLTFQEHEVAFNYLHRAYKKGERSPLFYVCLARAFAEAAPQSRAGELLLPLISWALNTGCHVEGIVMKHQVLADNMLRRAPKIAEKLYAQMSADWILHIIATSRMIRNDTSLQAFYYYKETASRQLFFSQLDDFLIRAAFKNDIEEISGFTLASYLKKEPIISEDLLPFVYHLVLKGKLGERNNDLWATLKPDIIRSACTCLDNNLYGKYYFSLYKYLLDLHATDVGVLKVDKKYLTAAEEVIKNLLFAYDIRISNSRAKKVLIQEAYKKGEVIVEPREGRVRVNLWSSDAKITCFDDTMRNIIDTDVIINRLVDTADVNLYKRMYAKGHKTPELLIYLAQLHIGNAKEELSPEAISIFEELKQTGISRIFLKQINAVMGNHYARQGDFRRAVEFFKDLSDTSINKNYLEQMLVAYINAGDYDAAAGLIVRWSEDLQDKSVFWALKQAAKNLDSVKQKRGVAAVAAKMLTRGWFDADLMNITLKHHACPLSSWVDLAKSLTSLGIFEPRLHEKILSTAILTSNHTRFVQSIFVNMVEKAGRRAIVADFALYMSYEILANSFLPEKTTVYAMEGLYDAGDVKLAYALAHAYIRQGGATTEKSRSILAETIATAYDKNIIFPIFKEIKDKTLMTAYIEKNKAFVHRTKAGRNVTLHYRISSVGEFFESQMQYLAFGLYYCHIPHFYGEVIEYYFCETLEKGSIKTTPSTISNKSAHMLENAGDLYYTINNALIYEQMFKYDKVEEIVTAQLAKKLGIRAKSM